MKIILGKQIEEVKKKDSENEKNLLKNRNSEDINELNEDDIYFHSNAIKYIKLGTNTVNRIYLNHSIVYELQDTIDSNLFHSLVPAATASSIVFDKLENQDVSNFNLIGFCDANNHIAVYNYNTEYLILNIRNAINYAPLSCSVFLAEYSVLNHCIFINFDTSYVTLMVSMFRGCSSLTNLDLSNFNTDKVTYMDSMFFNCRSLTTLNLSNFNTNSVLSMGSMFNGCNSLTNLDLSNFYTDKLTYISNMFYNCSSLTYLNLSNFNTDKVTYMDYMFYNCSSLTNLNLSNFNTGKVKTMEQMFSYCSSLQKIISNTFSDLSLTSSWYMFYRCTSLVGGNGTAYSYPHTGIDYARVDGENGLPGYFTAPPANKKINKNKNKK